MYAFKYYIPILTCLLQFSTVRMQSGRWFERTGGKWTRSGARTLAYAYTIIICCIKKTHIIVITFIVCVCVYVYACSTVSISALAVRCASWRKPTRRLMGENSNY